jgi:hypothetical protein
MPVNAAFSYLLNTLYDFCSTRSISDICYLECSHPLRERVVLLPSQNRKILQVRLFLYATEL